MRRGATTEIIHRMLASQGHEVNYDEFRGAYIEVRRRQYQIANVNWEEFDHEKRLGEALKVIGFQHPNFHRIVSRLWKEFLQEWPRDSIPYEGTMPLLKHLRSRYKLGLVTNFPDGPTARTVIEKYRLDDIFDVIIISGEEGYRKPKHLLFDKALSMLRDQPETSVMVGDTLVADVVGPKEIGMKAILVDENGSKKESYHIPDAVVRYIGEVREALTWI